MTKIDEIWNIIQKKPHHGIAISLSSIHTKKSSGVGEFLDLILLIDFCKKIGFDTIQLLPINDTGPEASPYYAQSSCALDPLFLSLSSLPNIGVMSQELISFQQYLHLPKVALLEIKQKKLAFLYEYFLKTFPSFSHHEAYLTFLKENPWLKAYALFKSLKRTHQDSSFLTWPEEDQKPTDASVQKHETSIAFYSFLQFLSFSQMKTVKQYANSQGIYLKGDIPILLSPDSVDVWENPSFFNLDLIAGAPPDAFNKEGQKWGFPIYLWDVLRQNHFSWWKRRLQIAENFFHIYRIDHVVGLFRIFAIEKEKTAKEGFFIPHDPHLWPILGKEILEMLIESSNMLPIAEDLGTIPKEVRPILKELGICRTCVMRWQKKWDHDHSYIPFNEYEPLSLTCVSTQDSEPLALWWAQFPNEAHPFAEMLQIPYQVPLNIETRFTILQKAHATPSYFHINLLQEYLALFPNLVSQNPEEERINIPGTILPTNWTYRILPSIEELIHHEELCQKLESVLKRRPH